LTLIHDMPSPTFAAHVLTIPQRRTAMAQTVANLTASDWRGGPRIHVELDENALSRVRIAAAYGQMLLVAADQAADYTLLLEDEIIVNRHLRQNVCAWEPVERGHLILGSLCNREVAHLPGYRPDAENEPSFVADTRMVLGAQALILSRGFLTYAAAHWEDGGAAQSRRLVRLASGFGKMHYHAPSLVQHIGVDDMDGTQRHPALDFDPDWRCG
jgi:hypothetical protein